VKISNQVESARISISAPISKEPSLGWQYLTRKLNEMSLDKSCGAEMMHAAIEPASYGAALSNMMPCLLKLRRTAGIKDSPVFTRRAIYR
jgi:hypothetical protein